ncbi:MAG TPA: twin-arginine translocation signal domain-containing protein [Candidatus Krumholzibacteria bacterium]|nr:twin-arginine translocation signal domain-containing protein [Candidatus Krumholzibacteria bacterium]HPD72489.1 twin-arginine translocation signal domain-containing protein [Candidatus Krumholzibacteria bacterium]HRY40579.1 twin-arginine translocation signal domain-containing protein [Candidatus Krumholzibacteria bacterium]
MNWTRRDFLKTSAAAGAAATASAWFAPRALADFTHTRSDQELRFLILGGTAFLGPAVVDQALARGHTVTLFNRGKTNPQLYPDLEKLQGDRDGDLAALAGREWDVVLDTSAYYPRVVDASAGLLRDHARQYIFISSISVYADFAQRGIDETSPVGTVTAEEVAAVDSVQKITGTNYGPLKALCEQAAERAMPGRTCSIRPGLIVGPLDRSGRFTYWPVRVAKGGEVLAPDGPGVPTEIIDVRDLAEFIVHCAERNICGVFNATSPPEELTIGEMLDACRAVSGSDAAFTWVDKAFLAEHEVAAWSDLPVWVPLDGEDAGHPFVRVDRAIAAGLRFRPIRETVRGTLEWWATLSAEDQEKFGLARAGLRPEREAELLAAWHARNG